MNLNKQALTQAFEQYKQQAEKQAKPLDLTRGKPAVEQVSLTNELASMAIGDFITKPGVDIRNYGGIEGIDAARQLGQDLLDIPKASLLAQGNSSLSLMFHAVLTGYLNGYGGEKPWSEQGCKEGKIRFLCPVPGYDRHFKVCEAFNIQMVNIAFDENGPDMDQIEKLVKEDHSIKGIWCVPKHSNPTGHTYSEQTVKRFAKLGKIAAPDFRILWDNAYACHDLSDQVTPLANLFDLCQAEGTLDSLFVFGSTSKITFAGSGVAFVGGSDANLSQFKKLLGLTTIGPDKINQAKHAQFLPNKTAITAHMAKHAQLIAPKFAQVEQALTQAFGNKSDIANWSAPEGGYFISFNTKPGLAKKVIALCEQAGVKLTPAGATYPHGQDPQDCNIRLAPTYPSVEELEKALEIFVVCVQLASID